MAPLEADAVAVIVAEVPRAILAPFDGAVTETVGTDVTAVTATAVEVTTAPAESVTRAVIETEPAEAGIHETVYGEEFAVPTSAVPAKKSTFEIVAGETAVAVAVSPTLVPTTTAAPEVGAEMAIVGPVTFTLTAVEVATVPLVSVTRAVSALMPVALGDQVTEYGDVKAVPTIVVPARKSTRLTTAPPEADAVAVSEVLAPRATVVPFVGAVSATVGTEVATVTATAEEVAAAPLLSVTRAVSETAPAVMGVQLNVKGAANDVLRSVVPEKNSTLDMVAGPTAEAEALIVALDPSTIVLAAKGAVKDTDGLETITLLVGEVAVAPLESVTRAERATTPADVGVQETE